MTTHIPQRELRNQNAAIIAAVVAGESFVVTRNGIAVAELRPVAAAARRTHVSKAEVLSVARSSSRIDAARFRADLDAVVDPGL